MSTAVVCVYVIYTCWQTKNSAEKTGVFLHKLANIVDENHFYETVGLDNIFPKCSNFSIYQETSFFKLCRRFIFQKNIQ